jgi:hypothetical protein
MTAQVHAMALADGLEEAAEAIRQGKPLPWDKPDEFLDQAGYALRRQHALLKVSLRTFDHFQSGLDFIKESDGMVQTLIQLELELK